MKCRQCLRDGHKAGSEECELTPTTPQPPPPPPVEEPTTQPALNQAPTCTAKQTKITFAVKERGSKSRATGGTGKGRSRSCSNGKRKPSRTPSPAPLQLGSKSARVNELEGQHTTSKEPDTTNTEGMAKEMETAAS